MTLSNLTLGQKQFLLTSLESQKSPMTSAERNLFNELRDFFAEVVEVDNSRNFKRCGQYIKMIHMDTFGDNYKNNWIKVQESGKGEFITMSYTGNTRMYLN